MAILSKIKDTHREALEIAVRINYLSMTDESNNVSDEIWEEYCDRIEASEALTQFAKEHNLTNDEESREAAYEICKHTGITAEEFDLAREYRRSARG